MIEIGAGGGSIAQVDRLGLVQVGPESCQRRSGTGLLRPRRHAAHGDRCGPRSGLSGRGQFPRRRHAPRCRRRRGVRCSEHSPSRSACRWSRPPGRCTRPSMRTWLRPLHPCAGESADASNLHHGADRRRRAGACRAGLPEARHRAGCCAAGRGRGLGLRLSRLAHLIRLRARLGGAAGLARFRGAARAAGRDGAGRTPHGRRGRRDRGAGAHHGDRRDALCRAGLPGRGRDPRRGTGGGRSRRAAPRLRSAVPPAIRPHRAGACRWNASPGR